MTTAQSVNSLISLDPEAQAKRSAFWRLRDRVTQGLAAAGAGTMILMLLLLTYVLVEGALPAIRTFGFKFFVETDWDPVEMHFGAASMIFGTIVTSVLAMVIAVPLSIGVALFLNRIGPRWLEPIAGFLIELLAAIPSITYGFWGVAVLVPWLQKTGMPFLKSTVGQVPYLGKLFSGPAFGFSILASSLVLAIMILPIITLVARDVLKAVPKELEQGAYALGATWWQATKLILIYAKLGLLGAVTLGFARAVGETMAVTMIIGNRNAIDYSLLAPGQTMSSLLANEFLEADKPEYLQALVYVAATLLLFTLLMNVLARWCITLVDRQKKRPVADDGDMSQLKLDKKEEKKVAAVPESALPASFKQEPPFHVFRVKFTNKLVRGLCVLSFAISMTLLCAILGYVLYRGFSSVNLDFFTKLPGPTGTPIGMRNCLVGTVILVGIGSLVGIPVGVLTGIYLAEYAKKSHFNNGVRLVVDVLAGTPSIIVGVMAYEIVVKPLGHPSGWAGGVALGFLMCPVIAKTTEEMLKLVPGSYREGSLGLGASRYHTLLRVVLPAASAGIITGILLSIARVAGETAPLIFTALGNDSDVWNPNKPMPALTLKIFQYATSAEQAWIQQAWAGMLVLVFSVLIFSIGVRYVTRKR